MSYSRISPAQRFALIIIVVIAAMAVAVAAMKIIDNINADKADRTFVPGTVPPIHTPAVAQAAINACRSLSGTPVVRFYASDKRLNIEVRDCILQPSPKKD